VTAFTGSGFEIPEFRGLKVETVNLVINAGVSLSLASVAFTSQRNQT
jgi:hypothetical protein